MRDHLLGYAPSAAHSAELEEEAAADEYGWLIYEERYPLGVPLRVRAEIDARLSTWGKPAHLRDFESKAHAYPDGTHDPMPRAKLTKQQQLHQVIQGVLDSRRDALTANLIKGNAMLKGISCKPAPEVMQLAPAAREQYEAQKATEAPAAAPVDVVDAYMRGYEKGRIEDTRAQQAENAEKARAFAFEQAERIKRNAEARAREAVQARIQRDMEHANAQHLGVGLGYQQDAQQGGYIGGSSLGGFITGARNSPWHSAEPQPYETWCGVTKAAEVGACAASGG